MEVELINQQKTGKGIFRGKGQNENGKQKTQNKRVEMCHSKFKWVGLIH